MEQNSKSKFLYTQGNSIHPDFIHATTFSTDGEASEWNI